MRRIAIAAGTGVHADPLTLFGRKARQREVVQIDEAVQQVPGRIDLHRQAAFGEVDLHLVGALPKTPPDLYLVLRHQIVDELLAWVI